MFVLWGRGMGNLSGKAWIRPFFGDWQLRSCTVSVCDSVSVSRPGAMASGEEDGALEEKETNNKKRTKSIIATAWLMFYNIAMTAGYVRINVVFNVSSILSTLQWKLALLFIVSELCSALTVYGQHQ